MREGGRRGEGNGRQREGRVGNGWAEEGGR